MTFSSRISLSKKVRRERLDVREPFPCPLDSRFSRDRVSYHTYLIESMTFLLVQCTQSPLFMFPCPWTCPWLQQGQEAGFSSYLSRVSDNHLLKPV